MAMRHTGSMESVASCVVFAAARVWNIHAQEFELEFNGTGQQWLSSRASRYILKHSEYPALHLPPFGKLGSVVFREQYLACSARISLCFLWLQRMVRFLWQRQKRLCFDRDCSYAINCIKFFGFIEGVLHWKRAILNIQYCPTLSTSSPVAFVSLLHKRVQSIEVKKLLPNARYYSWGLVELDWYSCLPLNQLTEAPFQFSRPIQADGDLKKSCSPFHSSL